MPPFATLESRIRHLWRRRVDHQIIEGRLGERGMSRRARRVAYIIGQARPMSRRWTRRTSPRRDIGRSGRGGSLVHGGTVQESCDGAFCLYLCPSHGQLYANSQLMMLCCGEFHVNGVISMCRYTWIVENHAMMYTIMSSEAIREGMHTAESPPPRQSGEREDEDRDVSCLTRLRTRLDYKAEQG